MADIKLHPLDENLLREQFSYDPETGYITNKVRRATTALAGAVAGSVNSQGYRHVKTQGVQIKAHRLAWFLHHGEWPSEFIDHINRVKHDNRLANLRGANMQENQQNRVYPNSHSRSPYRGVTWRADEQKWVAQIKVGNGKRKHLGRFGNALDAYRAYIAAKQKYHQYTPSPTEMLTLRIEGETP